MLCILPSIINVHTPALCNITAFARPSETLVHPIQCRLVTPDEPEERIAYLKEFGMVKDYVHGNMTGEHAADDESLDFDVFPDGATEQAYTVDLFGEEFDDQDVDGLYEILNRVKKESPYYQKEAEAASDPPTTSQSTALEQATDLVGDEVQINVQSFLKHIQGIAPSSSASETSSASKQTQTPMPARDEL